MSQQSDTVKPSLHEMKEFADGSGEYLTRHMIVGYANWFAEQEGLTKRFSLANECTPLTIQWYKEMMVKYYNLEVQD